MSLKEKFKIFLQEEVYNPKCEDLVRSLEDLMLYHHKYYTSQKPLTAIQFEFDMLMCFQYTGYPAKEIEWIGFTENIILDLSDVAHPESILSAFIIENNTSELEIDSWCWSISKQLELDFFSKCWKVAKENSWSSVRGFLLEHDVYRGIDCDTGMKISSEEIEDLLENGT